LHELTARTVATGLTTPTFTETAPGKGESVTYTILAVGQNGASAASIPVSVSGPPGKPVRED
jgi:hypothetical protein